MTRAIVVMVCDACSGFAVGIYTTNTAEACEYVAANCEANVLIVENDMQLQKILKVRSRLPHLKAIVQYTGELKQAVDKCYTVSARQALPLLPPNFTCF